MAKRGRSPWVQHVMATYNSNKHKAGYKFKHAMRDAKKTFKAIKMSVGASRKTRKA
jgi:hypothetical protein